jgi:hypothetical protein
MSSFAPDRCPCGYPWELCPWQWDMRKCPAHDTDEMRVAALWHQAGFRALYEGTGSFVCAACGALQDHNTIRCEECGQPLVFLSEAVPRAFVVDG